MQGDPQDVCECGDYRHQHQAGVGSCCFNAAIGGAGHHGAPDCNRFRLSLKANEAALLKAQGQQTEVSDVHR
jgi:hypothetical protein